MLSWILIAISMALGSGGGGGQPNAAAAITPIVPELPQETGEASTVTNAASEREYIAEPQVPTGKFTTAAEIKQIMTMTKGSWIAVREYEGQDLLYVTQILAWRCGLLDLRVSVNGGPMESWPMPKCYMDTAQPNAITGQDGLIYQSYPLGAIQSVAVELVYDDLTRDQAGYDRKSVLMP